MGGWWGMITKNTDLQRIKMYVGGMLDKEEYGITRVALIRVLAYIEMLERQGGWWGMDTYRVIIISKCLMT